MALTSEYKSSRLFKESMGVSETTIRREFFEEPIYTRSSIVPSQVWMYGDKIPGANDSKGLTAIKGLAANGKYNVPLNEKDTVDVVQRIEKLQLTKIDDITHNSFKVMQVLEGSGVPVPIETIIPFNFGDGETYNYALYKADENAPDGVGSQIAFGVGDWVLDTNSGVLTFYGDVPSGVAADKPPFLSFYKYIADIGLPSSVSGFEAFVATIRGVNAIPIDRSGTSIPVDESNATYKQFITGTNTIDEDFIKNFKWDGSDNGEGVAVSFNAMFPIVDSATKDTIKNGIGMDADAEVLSLISNKGIDPNTTTIFDSSVHIDFISQNAPEHFSVAYFPTDSRIIISSNGQELGKSTTGLNTLDLRKSFQVDCSFAGENPFFVTFSIIGSLPAIGNSVDINPTKNYLSIGLFTRIVIAGESKIVPWTNTLTTPVDMGLPVVTKLGRVLPSRQLKQYSFSGTSGDSVSSDKYGVRPHTVVVAVIDENNTEYNTQNPEGVDYLVRNRTGHFLQDILTKAIVDLGEVGGNIYLRAGTYLLTGATSLNANIQILGESLNTTFIQASNTAAFTITDSNDVVLSNITMTGAMTVDATESNIALNNVLAPNTTITATSSLVDIDKSSISSLTLSENASSEAHRTITNSSVGSFEVNQNAQKVVVNNTRIASFLADSSSADLIFTNNVVTMLRAIPDVDTVIFTGNTVVGNDDYDGLGNRVEQPDGSFIINPLSDRFKMTTGKLEVIDTEHGKSGRRWVDFAPPYAYNTAALGTIYETTDADGNSFTYAAPYAGTDLASRVPDNDIAVGKRFQLLYDDRTLMVHNGKLEVKAEASVIKVANQDLKKAATAIGEAGEKSGGRQTNVPNHNVKEALQDLYLTKADLDATGKLLLTQLPEDVVHGGLAFKGVWSFEANGGKYPTYGDLAGYIQDGNDLHPGHLQIGWFVVVSNSDEPDHPGHPQVAEDGIEYTSGDWCIYHGNKDAAEGDWVKLDNSIAEGAYSLLPSIPPNLNSGISWIEKNGGEGYLDLANLTLAEGFDKVNEVLSRLAPPKPALLTDMNLITTSEDPDYPNGYLASHPDAAEPRQVFDITHAVTTTTEHLFFSGAKGSHVESVSTVDGSETPEAITIDETHLDDADIVAGNLTIRITDPYAGIPGQERFWKGVKASVQNNPTTIAPMQIQFKSNPDGSAIAFESQVTSTVYVDAPEDVTKDIVIDSENNKKGIGVFLGNKAFTDTNSPDMFNPIPVLSVLKSGVPSLARNTQLTLNDHSVCNAFTPYYNTEKILELAVNVQEALNTYSFADGEKTDKDFKVTTPSFNVEDVPTEEIVFTATSYTSKGLSKTETKIFDNLRLDPTVEGIHRVHSGTNTYPPYENTPAGFGFEYDTTESCLDNTELQHLYGEYRWPTGDYSRFVSSSGQGPNYDTVVPGTRWATFKFQNIAQTNSLLIQLKGLRNLNDEDIALEEDKTINRFFLAVRFISADGTAVTNWLDANKPYVGTGRPLDEGDGILDISSTRTTIDTKRITFGTALPTGDFYVRVGLTDASNLAFEDVIVKNPSLESEDSEG